MVDAEVGAEGAHRQLLTLAEEMLLARSASNTQPIAAPAVALLRTGRR